MDRRAYIYAFLAAVLWASTAATVKLLLEGLDALQVLLFTSLFATASLLAITAAQGKLSLLRKHSMKDYWRFSWMGALGVFAYSTLLFGALQRSTAQEAFIINYTWPLWMVILAMPLLKERFNTRKAIALLAGFAGVYLVATQGGFLMPRTENLYGNLLALAAAFCYGLFSVLGKRHDDDKTTSMLIYFTTTLILSFAAVLTFSNIPTLNPAQWAGLLWLGVFATALPFISWFLALKHGDVSAMSSVVFLTPFMSLIYIYFLLEEPIHLSSILGLGLITAGILLQPRTARYHQKKKGPRNW
jgi:drug/metabolite transporter (DMT)-like permease